VESVLEIRVPELSADIDGGLSLGGPIVPADCLVVYSGLSGVGGNPFYGE